LFYRLEHDNLSVEHMKNKREINGVEAVNKALEILNCFTERDETLSVTKISNITGNYKSRISRISKSLENYGYLRKLNNGKLKLGNSIGRLIEIYDNSFNFKNLIKDELDLIVIKSMKLQVFLLNKKKTEYVC